LRATLERNLFQRKLARHFVEQPVFFTLHLTTFPELQIVEAAQVQQAMNDVTNNFTLPIRAKRAGLRRAELSWTLEDNVAINAGIEAAGGRRHKTYRLYEKHL